MWDDALEQLQHFQWSAPIRKKETEWRARIYLGREQYDDIIRLAEGADRRTNDIEEVVTLALLRQGQRDAASQTASAALRKHRRSAKRAMGHVYAAEGDYERALLWYERDLGGTNPFATLRLLGETLMQLGDYREASQMLDQAIRLAPYVRVEDMRHLAECLRKIGKEQAAGEVEQLICSMED
jgi:tetratricopeptide (TPR) repeat protein